jgi:siroheme synthase
VTTAQGGASLDRLHRLALAADTLVVLMPRSNLAKVAAVLASAVGGARPSAVISNATLANQQTISGPLEHIARLADQAAIGTPATLVVGDVVAAAPVLSVLPNSSVDGGFG